VDLWSHPRPNQEIESKFYVGCPELITQRLQLMGAKTCTARVYELNFRFDTPAGELQRSGRVLRLRRDEEVRLTYKDAGRLEAGTLSRRELEVTVSKFDATQQLLEALGYEVVFIYEKHRTTYDLGGARIMLDELPYGDFVEIEGDFDSLRPVAAQLGLDWDAAIPLSYHALFERLRIAHRLPFRDLTFQNFAGRTFLPADLGVTRADNCP
jgi:adenylate cyclase class 2